MMYSCSIPEYRLSGYEIPGMKKGRYMEIERKFLADPSGLDLSLYRKKEMSQGYVSTDPVIRIRRSDGDYILTVKNGGLLVREEFETPLSAEQYEKLSRKVEGIFLSKTRYLIPVAATEETERDAGSQTPCKDIRKDTDADEGMGEVPYADEAMREASDAGEDMQEDPDVGEDSRKKQYTIELDIFHGALDGLIYAEVEFPSVEEATAFRPPSWFLREVTEDGAYTNAALSRLSPEELEVFLNKLSS